jgi:hypothetical protein
MLGAMLCSALPTGPTPTTFDLQKSSKSAYEVTIRITRVSIDFSPAFSQNVSIASHCEAAAPGLFGMDRPKDFIAAYIGAMGNPPPGTSHI